MSGEPMALSPDGLSEALHQLSEATAAKKCWSCDCLHTSLKSIERAIPEEQRPEKLRKALVAARERLVPVRYDCLGCEVCFPPLAMNALEIEGEACPTETAEVREGWPALPGSYSVLRYRAPVAVCTLTDEELFKKIAARTPAGVAMVGCVHTENLGIERIIHNVTANPNIRFLVVCGTDSRQAVGHQPGQSLVSLARNGLDEGGRIVGAKGKRPMVKNVGRDTVEHFRQTVEVLDLIGNSESSAILSAIASCASHDPGRAAVPPSGLVIEPLKGQVPERMVSDPAGYFVVYADHARKLLSLEHYANCGVLDAIIEGTTAAEAYIPALEKGLVSRLDHAAYLGQELSRAERSLRTGEPFVQDAAPERVSPAASLTEPEAIASDGGCGCGPTSACSLPPPASIGRRRP